MKKWIGLGVVILCVIGGGGWYAEHRVKQAVGNQVVALLSQPKGQSTNQEINQLIQQYQKSGGQDVPSTGKSVDTTGSVTATGEGNESGSTKSTGIQTQATDQAHGGTQSSSTRGTGTESSTASSSASTPQFTSRAQVVQYAMSHFTAAEIVHYSAMYAKRSSLSSQQKNEIKEEILSHFTPAELAAMEAAAQKNP